MKIVWLITLSVLFGIAGVQESFAEQSSDNSRLEFFKEKMLRNTPIILEETYTNTEFNFSMKHPKNWHVHDEIISYPPVLGVDSGSDILVFLSPMPYETETPYVAVSIIKDYAATKYGNTQYLDFIMDEAHETCENVKRFFEFECTNRSVSSVGFPMIDGNKAYGFQDTWTNVFEDNSPNTTSTGITLDIVTGKNTWRIVSENFQIDGDYLVSDKIMLESIRSFEFIDSDVISQTNSTSIESTDKSSPVCGTGTELVHGFCQIIKTDEKPQGETSFFDSVFEFFKNLFN